MAEVGRYRIERKLGAGQMGDVYAAAAPDGRRVAVKVLRFDGANREELHKRFRREAELCKSLDHPNVVTVSDYGLHEGAPYMTMRLLQGRDLESWLEELGPLAPEVAVAIALEACAGLAAAHARGVVHRDFKPANVFLDESEGGAIRTVVCDFGIAKVYDEDGALTASGAVLGTPLYMAPEQLLDSKHVDARCDVWAVGMVLYHALAGRAAFADARGLADLCVLLRDCNVAPLQSFAPWVPASLARVVHAALLPLERRFGSIDDLARAIRQWGPDPAPLSRTALVRLADDRRSRVTTHAVMPKHAAELGTPDDDTVAEGGISPRAQSEPPSDALVGAVLGARYRVVGRLGHGGMGTVYEGIDEKAAEGEPRDLAIKVMAGGEGGTEGTRRFLREAKAAMRIESPHVTKVRGSGVDTKTGAQYLVMERLHGRDLADILHAHGALQPEPAVALFLQAAEGLRAAHGIGVVHRDVKPSNLFVHELPDGTVVLKVCDFGIAKQLVREGEGASTELTRTGGLLGSPLYMSPEQARSAKYVDERSDVFSLAITLHEALSGLKPWQGRTSMGEIILAVCTEDVPSLSTCAPWVPPALADVVARGVARDPNARFATIAELEAALAPFAAKGPLTTAQLTSVTDERRSKIEARAMTAPHTADAVSVATNPERERPKRTGITVVAAAIAVAGVIAAGAYGARPKTEPVAPARTPVASVSLATTASAPALVGSASAAPSASVSASAVASAAAAPPTAEARVVRTRPPPGRASASVAPVAAPPSPASASTVGRGVTATDLPP